MHISLISCHGVGITSILSNPGIFVPIDSVPGELDFFRNTDDDLIPPLNAKSWEISLLGGKQSQCSLSNPQLPTSSVLDSAVGNRYDLGHLIPHALFLNTPSAPHSAVHPWGAEH